MNDLPPGHWEFFLCKVNDKLASIFVDLDALKHRQGLPALFIVSVPLLKPNPKNGMSTQEEVETLIEIEGLLIEHLGATINARIVGRITSDKWRQVYFYAPARRTPDPRPIMSRFPTYQMKVGWYADPEWKQYTDVLFPKEEGVQQISNRAVLEHLKKGGDALTAPREITHWSYFSDATARDAFVDQITSGGFRMITAGKIDAKAENQIAKYSAIYAKEGRVDQRAIDEVTISLVNISKRYGGKYDGWECKIIKSG